MTECRCVLGYARLYVQVIRRVCHSEDTASAQFLCYTVYSRRAMAQAVSRQPLTANARV
jgi:hypothetical protein